MKKYLKVGIHWPSCKSFGVKSDDFKIALLSRFKDQLSLEISFLGMSSDGIHKEGFSDLHITNSETKDNDEIKEIEAIVANCFRKLVTS